MKEQIVEGSFTKQGWHVHTTAQGERIIYYGIPVYGSQAIPSKAAAEWMWTNGAYVFE